MIGVIGGSGLYALAEDFKDISNSPTNSPQPYDLSVGTIAGKEVAFVPRHGKDHRYSPSDVPYRRQMLALQDLGVTKVIAVCAVGSLKRYPSPGELVVPQQIIDLTHQRLPRTLGPYSGHTPFADPYCSVLRDKIIQQGEIDRAAGVVVVIEGPRFSTRAESRMYAYVYNADLINMTQMPEALFARELGMCYATIAVVTDRDAAVPGEEVTYEEVMATFASSIDRVKKIVTDVIENQDLDYNCWVCPSSSLSQL